MSVYLFGSDYAYLGRTSRFILLSTTAFAFSVLLSASSFAEDAYVSECVGCKSGQNLFGTLTSLSEGGSSASVNVVEGPVSGGQIQTSGLTADEFDTQLSSKAEIVSVQSSVRETSAPSFKKAGSLASDSPAAESAPSNNVPQRQVYIPETPEEKVTFAPAPKTPAWKEAAINITPEEERYLRDTATYMSQNPPVPVVKASPVFDDYTQYMDVEVAPISAYKAAKKKLESKQTVADSSVSIESSQNDNAEEYSSPILKKIDDAVVASLPQASSVNDSPVISTLAATSSSEKAVKSSPAIPAFGDSLVEPSSISQRNDKVNATEAPQLSPLEALLLSDVSSPARSETKTTAAVPAEIPAFSNSLNFGTSKENVKAPEVKQSELLVPMDSSAYSYGNTYSSASDSSVSYGGAVNRTSANRNDGGYGTSYDSFVPQAPASYQQPFFTPATDNGDSLDSEDTAGAFTTPDDATQASAERGIIDKLKEWFTVPESSSTKSSNSVAATDKPSQASIAATVEEVISRYTDKNKKRNSNRSIAAADPTGVAIVFDEGSSNVSAKTVKWLSDFAEKAAQSENSVVRIQMSKDNLPLQSKRFALIKSVLAGKGISLDRIRLGVGGENPDSVVMRIETPTQTVGAYEKIEAMGGY